jgi:hypothetical protein
MNGRLINNGGGTATDSNTFLMWTISEIGKSPDGIICEGHGKGFTWSAAPRLFGRGKDKRYTDPITRKAKLKMKWHCR